MKTVMVLVAVLWAVMAGMAWAETTWVYPLGDGLSIDMANPCHIGDAALTYQDRLIHCYGEKGWRENQMMPTACEQKMQAAMEAMEPLAFGNPTPTQFLVALRLFNKAKTCWRQP